MTWQEDAPGARLPGAIETQRAAAISETSVQPARQSRKSDHCVYGLMIEIVATSTADLCEQIQLLEGISDDDWFAAARRRRLALAEVARRMVVRNA